MASTPWLTSNDLIYSVQRKISLPLSQNTFSNTDILAFINDEMSLSAVPSVMEYHEEFYTTYEVFPLVNGQQNYPIPSRAVGGKLRNIFYQDANGNLLEMTRLSPDEKAFYSKNSISNTTVYKFYMEGNDVVIVPNVVNSVGSIRMDYYIRPNLLVTNDNAAICTNFTQTITLTNASIAANDTVTIGGSLTGTVFVAVTGSPAAGTTQFQIGASSTATGDNLVTAINATTVGTAVNVNGVVTVTMTANPSITTSNTAGFTIPKTMSINCSSVSSTVYSNGMTVDILQTKPGHKIINYDVVVPTSNGISGNTINLNTADVPLEMVAGDYLCPQYQCIIPYLPTDLHSGLAERAALMVLNSIGDAQGAAVVNQKIQDIKHSEGTLIDNRTEGNPKKVPGRHGILSYQKIGNRRFF